jgi:hydrogenase nickel incorporation protein HypA/HybF
MASMHEMSLAEGVIGIAEDAARREHARRVRTVVLEIGRLSAVEPQALAFCLEVVSRGTLAEGATFSIVDVPGGGWCMRCSREVPMATSYDDCPHCGSGQVQIVRGTEMRVRELEIE